MKKLNKKLSFKKEEVVKLDSPEMKNVMGGAEAFTSLWDCTHWTCTIGSTRDDTYGCLCSGGAPQCVEQSS